MSLSTNTNILEEEIKQVSKPLFDHFGVDCFSFSRHFRSDKREVFNLTTHLQKAKETAANVSSIPIFSLVPENTLLTSIYAHTELIDDLKIKRIYEKQIRLQKDKYDITSELSFLNWSEHYVDFYEIAFCGFGSNTRSLKVLENQDMIHHFMGYFTEKLSDVLDMAYQNRVIYATDFESKQKSEGTRTQGFKREAFIQDTLLNRYCGLTKNNTPVSLTHKEWLVALYLNSGYVSSKHLAKKLGLSPRTIEMHVSNLLRKFECNHKSELLQHIKNQKILSL